MKKAIIYFVLLFLFLPSIIFPQSLGTGIQFHSLVSTSSGTVYSWGSNSNGQLGNGNTTSSNIPVSVTMSGVLSGKSVTAVACGGYHSIALTSDGAVYAWGYNANGQLGNASTTDSNVPVAVNTSGVLSGKTITAVASGEVHTIVAASDGTVYSWGYNSDGQIGDGTNTESHVPVAVDMSGVLSGKTITAVAMGYRHSIALASDGTVYTWGWNPHGQLGNGNNTGSFVPVAVNMSGVLSGKTIIKIASGNYHSIALASDGTVYTWGWNNNGQLGNGTNTNSNVPVAVNTSGVLAGKTIIQVACGYGHSIAVASDGTVYTWGLNADGQLGDGTNTNSNVPVAVNTSGVLSGKTIVQVACGNVHSIALASDGTVYTWGKDANGQLGNGNNTNSNVPVTVADLSLGVTLIAPTTQASNISFSSIQTTQATISWTNGNGSARAVFIKQTNTGTSSPVNSTTYTANTSYSTGTQIGSTGWYCVYNGTGTSVTVTNLTAGTGYRVMVIEYNGTAGSELYNSSSATNNPNNFTTFNYSGGSGTSGAPYLIANTTDLKYLSEHSGEWGKYFKQTADITFSDADFQSGGNFYNSGSYFIPIGNSSTNFTGSYDGDGHKVSNLKINRGSTDYIGFFGYVSGASAEIKKLGIYNANITGNYYTGGLVGWNNGTVSNSYSNSAIYAATHGGGLVGHNAKTIQKSYAVGSLRGGNRLGGLVGVQDGSATITNSYSMVAVTSTFSQNLYGGLVGDNYGAITNSYATGIMMVNDNSRGGLVGRSNGTVTNGYWDTDATGLSTSAAGTGKTTAQMKVQATFTGWDFTTIWAMDGILNDGYPYLQDVLPPIQAPATQASNITFSSIQTTQATISWTNGNGSNRAVFIKQANSGSASPVDGTTYTANSVYSSGTQIGSTGWYCIYNGTGTSVTVTGLATITDYRVMVTDYNGSSGNEKYNTSAATNDPNNFTTILGVPSLTSPSNNSTDVSLSPTLSWSLVTSADKYHLEVNTASDFTGSVIYANTALTTTSHQIGGLSDNTKYYWRVTAATTAGSNSDASSVSNFTTAQAASGDITLISPPPNTDVASTSPNLSWPATSGASKYHLEVNTKSDFTGTVVFDAIVTSTSLPLSGLSYNTTYYWRVTATSSALSKTKTTVYSFTTKLAPPEIISPSDSTKGMSQNPAFLWASIPDVKRYNLLMSTNYYFTTIVLQKQLPDTSYQLETPLELNTGYYWKVSAVNSQGNAGEYTPPVYFKTKLNSPLLLSPANDSSGIGFTVTVIWDSVQGADKYRLEVNTKSDFTGTVVFSSDTVSSTSEQISGLANSTTYYWRVTGLTSDGNTSDISSTFTFTTGIATGLEALKNVTPESYSLSQNYPNPFNPSTIIRYALPTASKVSIVIYNVLGQEVYQLVNTTESAGYHEVTFNADHLASGIYLYRLIAGSYIQTKKMNLLK